MHNISAFANRQKYYSICLPFLAGGVGFLLNSLIFPSTALLKPLKRSDWRRLAERLINKNLKCYLKILCWFIFFASCIWICIWTIYYLERIPAKFVGDITSCSILYDFCFTKILGYIWFGCMYYELSFEVPNHRHTVMVSCRLSYSLRNSEVIAMVIIPARIFDV